jgi:hypothetical protein
MSWFLESWAVPEGCAFATHFDPSGDARGLANRIAGPDQVIYVCPPHFTPTPVGYATAVAALRGRFQEKFTDQHGKQVDFASLEQLIELVRRAYLAAGAGGSPPPGDAPSPKEPSEPPDGRDEHVEAMWKEAVRRLRAARTRPEKESTAQYVSTVWSPYASKRLTQFCVSIVEALIGEATIRSHDILFERDLRDLMLLSLEINEWPSWYEADAFLGHAHHARQAHVHGIGWGGHPPHGWWWAASADGLSASLASGLLCRLPSPYVWAPFQSLKRLGDHLAAATADRRYLASIGSFERSLPLLFCCFALAAAESYRHRSSGAFGDATLVRSRGFKWLAMEMPDDQLDNLPAAGLAIEQVLSRATSTSQRATL